MTDAMLDIETLGTDPGCVIVSIGVVRFDVDEGVGEEFYRSVDIEDCQDCGLAIDGDTLKWWLDQSADAREQLAGGVDLDDALRELSVFVEDCDQVWANPPAFDLVILEAAYQAVGWSAPWDHWDQRDYRTVREEFGDWPDVERDGTHHDALDDARYQARCLVECLRGGDDE